MGGVGVESLQYYFSDFKKIYENSLNVVLVLPQYFFRCLNLFMKLGISEAPLDSLLDRNLLFYLCRATMMSIKDVVEE